MRVKRYVVDSMPDALAQIRTDLGKDAVILNTKEIRSGGFLGLFSKKKIEVIAATDSLAKADSRPKTGPIQRAGATQPAAPVAVLEQPKAAKADRTADLLESIERLANKQPAPAEPEPAPRPVVPLQLGAAAYGSKASTAPVAAAPAPAPAAEPAAALRPAEPRKKPEEPLAEDPVLSELRAMRQMMKNLAQAGSAQPAPHPLLAALEARLLEQEVLPELAQEVIGAIEEKLAEEEVDLTPARANAMAAEKLRQIMGNPPRMPLQPETRIAHFVGPTGVGKTTTIAKLAAEQVLRHRRKVGFITSDTYRIAAVEQLKTYATILGVPLEVVFSPHDLKKAFDNLQDCDIVFMDTAGRNFRNEMYVSELNALLQGGPRSETFLVLSLTMKYKDMKAVAENFSRFRLDKVLLTKKDETETFGPILNLLHEYPLALSYITTGQNVPDDFNVAGEDELIALILGEQANE
ncbi:flagellar biosynthesis protein FlhF [Paenibacillus sp. YN15]|uniref:flagellar biosynthesis protein FlhF n=1 Tax=Paenibacillus sp. YN15 TaxID=1742774 RepID=UPI000DCD51C9|nr:flagellar biosynthesis protein FlhF [Paenibacillus sp. YN15]RAV03528.1 flagellar biosynthesis protein FlhF [Paenibacillus sp. YN15]